jgi:ribosome-associated protein
VTADHTYTQAELPESLRQVLQLALDKGARGPVVLRVTELAGYTDWVLILSGRSDKHVQGITDGVLDGMAKNGTKPIGTDGLAEHTWDLLDFDDFLVHVFYHPVREFYDLESMWNDAPRVKLEVPADVMDTSDLAGLQPPDPMPGWRGNSEFGGFDDEFDDRAGDEDDELFGTE